MTEHEREDVAPDGVPAVRTLDPAGAPALGAAGRSRGAAPAATAVRPVDVLALQRSAGNCAVNRLLRAPGAGGLPGRLLQRIANNPGAIRDKWQSVITGITAIGLLSTQTIDLDRLRDVTIANEYLDDRDWAAMAGAVALRIDVNEKAHVAVPAAYFMTTMVKQIENKYRPHLSDTQKQLRKQKVSAHPSLKGSREKELKALAGDAARLGALDWSALSDPELVYLTGKLDEKTVRGRDAIWRGATNATATAGEIHVPVLCYYLWNATGGVGRVQADLADANTIYNRRNIHIDPLFIRQLTKADIEATLRHRVDDGFFLDFRGLDSGGHAHAEKKSPSYADADTKKIIERYIPEHAIGALWVGDMVADAGRSPGKSNDAREQWVVINTALSRNPIIFAHELGHLVFASDHPETGRQDTPGSSFTDVVPASPATLSADALSVHLKHNVLTSGVQMDAFWDLTAPTPADVHVSPGQAAKAGASALGYVNP